MAALQSDVGAKLVKQFDIPDGYLDSLVLIKNSTVYTHSKAALLLASELDGAWRILKIFTVFPKKLADTIYNWVAKNRYKWFGKKEVCMIPKPEHKDWFL